MHVKYVVLAVAVSGVAFYNFGRYGQALDVPLAPAAAVQPAMAAGGSASNGTQGSPPHALDLSQAPATAQGAAARPGQQGSRPLVVDESALRYFASQGDTRRLEAELARLRALYPEWKPSADLSFSGQVGDAELERMWKLFAEGKIGETRAAIAQRSTTELNWRAPDDLIAQLDIAEAGQRLVNASNARQAEQVIRIGTETPALLTCANVDALWRVAEAFVQTGKPERAQDAYAYVLTNCNMPAERVGTMQKALATLPDALTTELLAQERETEFSSIRDEIARRRIGRAAEDAKLVVSADDIKRIEELAAASMTPDDSILLGFYALRRNDPVKAEAAFKTALSRNGGAKAAEGAVLALGANKKYQEAEALGSQSLEAGAANRKAYLDVATALVTQEPPPKLDAATVARITGTVATDRYAPGGASIGWYAYNSGQIAPAETWFETALTWDRGYEPAAYGLALVRQRLRDRAGLRTLVTEWGRRSDRVAAILDPRRARSAQDQDKPHEAGVKTLVPASVTRDPIDPAPRRQIAARAAQAVQDEIDSEPRQSSQAATTARGNCGTGTTGAAALQRGWCLLNLKRPAAASAAFDAAMRSGTGQVAADAAAGKTYAKLQQGLTAEATAAAASTNLPPARRKELSALLLAENFYVQFDAKDYNRALVTLSERAQLSPETSDLMMMRGWAYFNLGRYDDAGKVFSALYRSNHSSQALSGLTAIQDATRRNRY